LLSPRFSHPCLHPCLPAPTETVVPLIEATTMSTPPRGSTTSPTPHVFLLMDPPPPPPPQVLIRADPPSTPPQILLCRPFPRFSFTQSNHARCPTCASPPDRSNLIVIGLGTAVDRAGGRARGLGCSSILNQMGEDDDKRKKKQGLPNEKLRLFTTTAG
jgi:hypothetical protein